MHKGGNLFSKWPQKEDKISNRSQIFRKFEPPEVAGSWGHFI